MAQRSIAGNSIRFVRRCASDFDCYNFAAIGERFIVDGRIASDSRRFIRVLTHSGNVEREWEMNELLVSFTVDQTRQRVLLALPADGGHKTRFVAYDMRGNRSECGGLIVPSSQKGAMCCNGRTLSIAENVSHSNRILVRSYALTSEGRMGCDRNPLLPEGVFIDVGDGVRSLVHQENMLYVTSNTGDEIRVFDTRVEGSRPGLHRPIRRISCRSVSGEAYEPVSICAWRNRLIVLGVVDRSKCSVTSYRRRMDGYYAPLVAMAQRTRASLFRPTQSLSLTAVSLLSLA